MTPQIIAPDHAVRLRARQDLLDKDGTHRATGEEWLVRDIGAYLPGVFEEVGQWVDCGYTSRVACRSSKGLFGPFVAAFRFSGDAFVMETRRSDGKVSELQLLPPHLPT